MTLVGKYMCYAILAIAVDLIWGYCGILSLGHAAFFSLGGYAMGMYLMRQIGRRGVYGDPILPDFMVFLNWKQLPWFWTGFNHFSFALLMVVLVPALLAVVFGSLTFRARVSGVYLSIITQAMSYALMLAFFRNDMGFGGNNGCTDVKEIAGFDLHQDSTRFVLLLITAAALVASYLACRAIVASRAGRVLRAIRDAKAARDSLATGSSRTKSGCSSSPPSSPASRARSMCRKWASSTRASLRRSEPRSTVVIWAVVGGLRHASMARRSALAS